MFGNGIFLVWIVTLYTSTESISELFHIFCFNFSINCIWFHHIYRILCIFLLSTSYLTLETWDDYILFIKNHEKWNSRRCRTLNRIKVSLSVDEAYRIVLLNDIYIHFLPSTENSTIISSHFFSFPLLSWYRNTLCK